MTTLDNALRVIYGDGMYGKHYESMYEGSMYGSGLAVFAVWGYVIAKTRGSCVELNPRKLADTLGGKVEEIEGAIAFLERPDAESRCKQDEGRHLVRDGQFQFRVPGWEYYQAMRDAHDQREYNRAKQAEWRAKQDAKKNGKPPKKRPGVVTGGPPRERQYCEAVGAGEEPEARLTAPEAGESGPAG